MLVEGEVAKVLLLAFCEALAGSLRCTGLRDAVSEGCDTGYRVSFLQVAKERGKAVSCAKIVYGAPARGFTEGSIRQ